MIDYLSKIMTQITLIYSLTTIVQFLCFIILVYFIWKSIKNGGSTIKRISLIIVSSILFVGLLFTLSTWYINKNTVQGLKYMESKKYSLSISHLKKAYDLYQVFGDTFHFKIFLLKDKSKLAENLGIAYRIIGYQNEAIFFTEKSIESDANNFNALVYLSELHYEAGNINKSLLYHKRVITTKMGNKGFFYYNRKGNSLHFLGNYQEAVMNFKKALQLDQSRTDLLVKIILSLCAAGKKGDALKYINSLDEETKETLKQLLLKQQSSCL